MAPAGIPVTNSQTYQTITIKPDGTIQPDTGLLERNGTTYTLKNNIFGSIEVQLGYITIDGAGYTLQGRKVVDERGIFLVGPDRSHSVCSGVSIKNLKICNFFEGIYVLGSSNNSIIDNFLNGAGIHLISAGNSDGDLITHNIFNNSGIFVDYNYGGHDVITENNFFGGSVFVDLSDAPIVDKNYWSNYTARYPDAKQLDSLGIWDTPYVDDSIRGTNVSIDYHPLIYPLISESQLFYNPEISPLPTPTLSATSISSMTPGLTPSPTQSADTVPSFTPLEGPEPANWILYTIAGVVAIFILVLGLLAVYLRKRRG